MYRPAPNFPSPQDLNGHVEELSSFQNIPPHRSLKLQQREKQPREILSHSFLQRTMNLPPHQGDSWREPERLSSRDGFPSLEGAVLFLCGRAVTSRHRKRDQPFAGGTRERIILFSEDFLVSIPACFGAPVPRPPWSLFRNTLPSSPRAGKGFCWASQ